MYNYLMVSFPNTSIQPTQVYNFSFYQNLYQHEVMTIQFRDWAVNYDVVEAGSPVSVIITKGNKLRTFYGYVYSVTLESSPGSNLTEVTAVGASMVMKNASQQIYKGLSADGVVQQIANKYNFVAYTVPHPRVYPQISQAGHTDWEILVRLAKQSGYSLRTQNTELYFQPMLSEYTSKRQEAQTFTMRAPHDPSGSNLYSFKPTIGESLDHYGDMKAAIAISGVDSGTVSPMSVTRQLKAKTTRSKYKPAFFDAFHTHVVATDPTTAQYEADAADERNKFPYRATAEVLGDPHLRPDLPVYLLGVGSNYEGYWNILGVEHRITEEVRGEQLYTSLLYLGTDSLGQANNWTDGNTILFPSTRTKRTVIPNVRQTVVVPQSILHKTSPNLGPQHNGTFGNTVNKNVTTNSSPLWRTKTATINPISQTSASSLPTSFRSGVPSIL